MSIESKLRLLISTKTDIKAAINEKGVTVNDALAFAEYGNKIREIESGGTAEEEKNALLLKNYYGTTAMECIGKVPKRNVVDMGVPTIRVGDTSVTVRGEPNFKVRFNGTDYKIGAGGNVAIPLNNPQEGDTLTFNYIGFAGQTVSTTEVGVAGGDTCEITAYNSREGFDTTYAIRSEWGVSNDNVTFYYTDDEAFDAGLDITVKYIRKSFAKGETFPKSEVEGFWAGFLFGNRKLQWSPSAPSVVPSEASAYYEIEVS